jgi:hypothetical protein
MYGCQGATKYLEFLALLPDKTNFCLRNRTEPTHHNTMDGFRNSAEHSPEEKNTGRD